MNHEATMTVYDLAKSLASVPPRTIIKPMHTLASMGPDGPENIETGLIRLELPIPGYVYIRESSYTRHLDTAGRVSFSRATSFMRRAGEEDAPSIVDEDGKEIPSSGLCSLLDSLPHLQNFDLRVFSEPPTTQPN